MRLTLLVEVAFVWLAFTSVAFPTVTDASSDGNSQAKRRETSVDDTNLAEWNTSFNAWKTEFARWKQAGACNGTQKQNNTNGGDGLLADPPVCKFSYFPTPTGKSSGVVDASALDSILPGNDAGEAVWKSIFPQIDPASAIYKKSGCSQTTGEGRPDWGPGCAVFGSGDLSGLANFRKAASLFPEFCNGPDSNRNLVELSAFFGNVKQETSGLLYSAELGSPKDALYGRGALQLTGAVNYVLATQGIMGPEKYYTAVSLSGAVTGPCALNSNDQPATDACWEACSEASPAQPPQGSGYNTCADPSVASQDPIAVWATAIWFWMNKPISPVVAGNLGLKGEAACSTAHNLVQDPVYACGSTNTDTVKNSGAATPVGGDGGWCPAAAMAQIGCPSCCTKIIPASGTPDPMSINRVGGYVEIAMLLGDPSAKADANSLFCLLLNVCVNGAQGSGSSTCAGNTAGLSYDCYLDGSCTGGGGKSICGGVEWTGADRTGVTCQAIPGNPQGATNKDCAACEGSQMFWPCDYVDISGVKTPLCQWVGPRLSS